MAELEKLEGLTLLVELSLVSNAVARRMLHRPLLTFRLPSIQVIDGIRVTEEERAKAEIYFMEQQVSSFSTWRSYSTLSLLPYPWDLKKYLYLLSKWSRKAVLFLAIQINADLVRRFYWRVRSLFCYLHLLKKT
jgi:hypothetical protein